MIRPIKPKDSLNFIDYCIRKEHVNDPVEAGRLFKDTQKRSTKCNIYENKGLQGILLAVKENDKMYIHLITDNNTIALQLMKQYIWGNRDALYITFPKWNSLVKPLIRLGFRVISKRGDKTVDLLRRFDKKFYFPKKRINNYE